MKVAIIGSGMAGLTAAKILKDAGHDVHIFEALAKKGMDAHSLVVDGGIIDSPLRVMNPSVWKNTIALAKSVGVEFFRVNTYMSCNWLIEEDSNQLKPSTSWLASGRTKYFRIPSLTDPKFINYSTIRIIKGFIQFQNALKELKKLSHNEQMQMTLAQFMNRYPCEPVFWHGCVMPVLYTLCTCDAKDLGNWTAKPLLDFIQKMRKGDPLLRMYGGTHGFVDALSDGLNFYSGAKVTQVVEQEDGSIIVTNAQHVSVIVDKVIIATPTHVIDFINEEKFQQELKLLRTYKFIHGELVIHTDVKCMPMQKKHWSALSYMMDKNYNQHMFTVWLNAVEPSLKDKQNIFQTWNPTIKIDEQKIIDRVHLTRAIVDVDTMRNTEKLKQMQQQKNRKVYFCGSWMCEGLPILESAVTSAMFVTKQLGVTAKFQQQAQKKQKTKAYIEYAI